MLRLVTFVIGLVTAATQSVAQEYRYALFDIPSLGGEYSSAGGIAADGTAVGFSHDESRVGIIVVWRSGQIMEQRGAGQADGMNDQYDLVGHSSSIIGTLWRRDGQVVELGTFGGDRSFAYGINNLGQIVGGADLPEGHPHGAHAFLWENGEMRDLGSPGRISVANAVNERTQVVGWFLPEDSNSTASFFWENDQFTVLPRLSGNHPVIAEAINDDGVVAGVGVISITMHAVTWFNGKITDIHDDSAALSSYGLAINNLGVVGGNMYSRARGRTVGFITENGRMIDLNDHLPPRRRWDITWVNDLNDFGQIAGRDVDRGRGVILSPVTPTLTLSGPDPGAPGQSSRLTATGCDPGARVYFLYGSVGGGAAIPGCDLQTGAALQISSPTLAGTATADANGQARLTRFIPASARGRTYLIQAAQPGGCKVSQLVVHTFE